MASIWDGTPYEVQSPAWRSAMAGGGNAGSKTKSFNSVWSKMGIDMLEAWQSVPANQQTTAPTNDGQSNFLNSISGLGAALLQGMGGQSETQPEYMPVAYSESGGGGMALDWRMIALIGAGAGLIYYASVK